MWCGVGCLLAPEMWLRQPRRVLALLRGSLVKTRGLRAPKTPPLRRGFCYIDLGLNIEFAP